MTGPMGDDFVQVFFGLFNWVIYNITCNLMEFKGSVDDFILTDESNDESDDDDSGNCTGNCISERPLIDHPTELLNNVRLVGHFNFLYLPRMEDGKVFIGVTCRNVFSVCKLSPTVTSVFKIGYCTLKRC